MICFLHIVKAELEIGISEAVVYSGGQLNSAYVCSATEPMQKTKPLPSGLTYASWPPPTCEHLFCAVEEAAGCQEPTQLDTGPWVGETGWVVCHGEPTAKCTCGLQLVAGALPSE